jgi:hypothetical protein
MAFFCGYACYSVIAPFFSNEVRQMYCFIHNNLLI